MNTAPTTLAPPSTTTLEDAALDLAPPAVILRAVTSQLEARHCNLAGVGATIARSPILSLHLLREANRPDWNEKTVRPTEAVRRLGPEWLSALCQDLASRPAAGRPSLVLLKRANRTARTAAFLAKLRFAFDRQHAAHVAGLLTVVGVVVAKRLGLDLAERPGAVAEAAAWERERLGVSHAEIMERLSRHWFFPHELAEALGSYADQRPPEDGLARAVWLAARLVDSPDEALEPARACGFSAEEAEMVCFQYAIGPTKVPLFEHLRRPCPLTERQLDYLRHLAAGESREQIAARFGRARRTVDNVLSLAYSRLGVSGENRALMLCREQGWV